MRISFLSALCFFFFSPPLTSFPRYSQMAKLQLCSPLHTLIMFDGHPAAKFQGGHALYEMTLVTKENFYLESWLSGVCVGGVHGGSSVCALCACECIYFNYIGARQCGKGRVSCLRVHPYRLCFTLSSLITSSAFVWSWLVFSML